MLKQLLEKANRKCEMQWRAYAYDPEKDNELVKTSDTFDCIDCAMQFKRDYLAKHCNHIVQIVAESKSVKSEAYKVGDKVRVTSKSTFGYGNTGTIKAINGDRFTVDFNAPNSGTIKLSAKDVTKESAQKNEEYKAGQLVGDKFTKDYVTILKIVKPNKEYAVEYPNGSRSILTKEELDSFNESAQKNESIRIKTTFGFGKKSVDANYAKAADAVDVVRRTITDNTDKGTKMTITIESAQKNEAYSEQYKDAWNNLKAGDIVQVTDKNYQFTKKMKVARIYTNGTNKIVEFAEYTPSGAKYKLPLSKIYKDSNEYKAESAQKNESLNLDKLTDEDAKQLIIHLQDFIKDKSSKYYHIDKIETILKKKYKAESIKNEEIDDDSTGIVKKDDEKQMTEARGWRVSIKLQSKDNMNNINVEDAIEDALNDAGFTVNDVDAQRM